MSNVVIHTRPSQNCLKLSGLGEQRRAVIFVSGCGTIEKARADVYPHMYLQRKYSAAMMFHAGLNEIDQAITCAAPAVTNLR